MFAALEVKTGKISADACYQRHTNAEFLKFLKLVAKAHPRVKLHVIVDNYATHKHPNVKAWLAKNPRVTLHFAPTSCSRLNMVEIFFGIITRQAMPSRHLPLGQGSPRFSPRLHRRLQRPL